MRQKIKKRTPSVPEQPDAGMPMTANKPQTQMTSVRTTKTKKVRSIQTTEGVM